jgi:hypothetical protein
MFGRRSKPGRHSAGRDITRQESDTGNGVAWHEDSDSNNAAVMAPLAGPFDSETFAEDGVTRLDLGSIQLPVPEGAGLQVEMDPENSAVRAVHLLTEAGQLTISAFAAPRHEGLWTQVSGELIEELRKEGFRPHRENGEWGQEIVARKDEVRLRFIGIDGPRWLLRGVAATPTEHHENRSAEALRAVLRQVVVARGTQPMPVRTPLPIELPDAIVRHIEHSQS